MLRLGGIEHAKECEFVDLRQQREGWQSRRTDQVGDVFAVFLRLLGYSMLLWTLLSGLPPVAGLALSVRRLSRDDSQLDFGLDAGQPVLTILQG